jgi:hypothetical protein
MWDWRIKNEMENPAVYISNEAAQIRSYNALLLHSVNFLHRRRRNVDIIDFGNVEGGGWEGDEDE